MTLRLSASILLFAILPGHAQPTARVKESAEISPASMRSILQEMGFEFTEKSADDGETVFGFQLNGHAIMLRSQVKSFQLSAYLADHFDPMKANQWNREHFSSGIYLDDQGCAGLRADVKFGGSFTNEMIEQFIRAFLTDVTICARFLAEPPPAPGTAAVSPVARTERPTSPIGPMEWSQLGQKTRSAPPSPADKPVPGFLQINRNISLKYDPEHWKQTASGSDGQFALEHSSGDAHALVIAEPIALPRGSVEDVALANAQSVDPNAKIVYRAQRRMNGADVRFLKIQAAVNAVPMAYWGLFYSGEYGAVQVVSYTAKSALPEFEQEFMDLLAGFVVSK